MWTHSFLHILRRNAKDMGIFGHGGTDTRWWCYLGGDGGVVKLKLFTQAPFNTIYVPVIGYFHEMAVFIRMSMKIAFGLGVAPIADVFGVSSPKAVQWLIAAKDLHKGFQFLRLMYTAASRAVVRAWLQTNLGDRTSFGELLSWIQTSCSTDKQFANVVYFFLEGHV